MEHLPHGVHLARAVCVERGDTVLGARRPQLRAALLLPAVPQEVSVAMVHDLMQTGC